MIWRLLCLTAVCGLCFAETSGATLRGRLILADGKAPVIETAGHARITIEGDPESSAVLHDARLEGDEFELLGQYKTPSLFVVGPFYTSRSMFVFKDGKRYTVSYWCSVCSIRAYTPGRCVCCQQETELDLHEAK